MQHSTIAAIATAPGVPCMVPVRQDVTIIQ